jgi:hypothetical protein
MIRELRSPNAAVGSISRGNAPGDVVSGATIVLHMT